MTTAVQKGQLTTSRGLRAARRRVALLFAVWALSGLWEVGHVVAHERDHDDHHAAEHAKQHTDDVVAPGVPTSTSADEGDRPDHSHPESSPVVSTGKGFDLESPGVLMSALELACHGEPRRGCTRATAARASPRDASAPGPRAPPIL